MGNSRGRLSIGDFNEGGAEPDRLYSTQASNSKLDLSRLAVYLRDEPVNYKMAVQVMINKTQDQSSSGLFEEIHPGVLIAGNKMDKLFSVVDLTMEKKRKVDIIDDDIQVGRQISFRCATNVGIGFDDRDDVRKNLDSKRHIKPFCSECLSVFKDIHQISKQQIERIEDLDRQDITFWGTPVPETIRLPNPASIPRNETKACPEAITDPQEQGNEPNNQEPDPGVNTSKKRRYGKLKGVQPLEIEEVPVDSHSGPSVPLLIGIPAIDVLSVGRGSHAEEASQKGRVRRKCDQCCCTIM